MTIHLNPIAQAEVELTEFLKEVEQAPVLPKYVYPPFPPGPKIEVMERVIMSIIKRAVAAERLMMEQHPDCGAENTEGRAALCKCHCHAGHYRHWWQPIIKTPLLNPDGTYHLLDRCKYCPDLRLKIIKAAFIKTGADKEKYQVVSLEYLIRGEQRVLTKEEWLERSPAPQDMKLLREGGV